LKIVPSNQSLILAGEPLGARGGADPFLDQASRLVAAGPGLTRVTILAARPDSTVVVQADYASREEQPPIDAQLPALTGNSSNALPLAVTNSAMRAYPKASFSSRNPIDLYARTQRGFEDGPRAALLDVLA